MLKGIAQYERSHGSWAAFLDEARAEIDPRWLHQQEWTRHQPAPDPALAQACVESHLPLDRSSTTRRRFPEYRRFGPDNVGVGNLGASNFLERRYHISDSCGFSNDTWACERRDGSSRPAARRSHRARARCRVAGRSHAISGMRGKRRRCGLVAPAAKPAAIMGCHDLRAFQVITAAQAAGLLVPRGDRRDRRQQRARSLRPLVPAALECGDQQLQSGYQARGVPRAPHGRQRPRGDRSADRADRRGARQSSDMLAIDDKNVAAAASVSFANAPARASPSTSWCGMPPPRAASSRRNSASTLVGRHRRKSGASSCQDQTAPAGDGFPLKRIAELTGLNTLSTCASFFKRLTRESPGEFRKRIKSVGCGDLGRRRACAATRCGVERE